jgi:polygalacturonase
MHKCAGTIAAALCLLAATGSASASENALAAPAAAACPYAPASTGHRVDVRDFGAMGNGLVDDTAAIHRAIAAAGDGGAVHFPAGSYRHDDIIVIGGRYLVVTGTDATLLSATPERSAVVLSGDGSTIERLAITSIDPGARGKSDEESGLVVSGKGNTVVGVAVSKSKSAGILLAGAQDATIACNRVWDTMSDGIHSTDGTARGLIAHNFVRNSGDDGIAVVSYRGRGVVSAMRIEDNRVEHVRWGRGISVIGSTQTQIQRNHVSGIAMAAGIIVAREASYDTPGASDVLIEGNTIEDVQQSVAPLPGRRRTGHASIELNSDSSDQALGVQRVRVLNNAILGSAYDGIRLLGNVADVSIAANAMQNVAGVPIRVETGNVASVIQCQGNTSSAEAVTCRW